MIALLLTNVVHGIVALVWTAGLKRSARPLPPALWADLLATALVLPMVVPLAHMVGVPGIPDDFLLMRMDLWTDALAGTGWSGLVVVGALLLGVALISLIQEVIPHVRGRGSRLSAARVEDPRLAASLARVHRAFLDMGYLHRWAHGPRIHRLEIDEPVAALHGFIQPQVVVSRGLIDRLDDEELDAVVAHELGHLARGGNGWLFVVWMVRLLQIASPAALVVFRALVEAQEAACDSLAARATRRPAALASALLKVQVRRSAGRSGDSAMERARREVVRRADIASTRLRVRALLDLPPSTGPTWAATAVAVGTLTLLLWGIR